MVNYSSQKLLLPQEIETFYVIPALRKYLAAYLKERGMKQKDIAELLGIHTAAISQYSSAKRGGKIGFRPEIMAEIKKSASVISDKASYLQETQRLLLLIRRTSTLCEIHRQFSPVPASCDPKIVGCHLM